MPGPGRPCTATTSTSPPAWVYRSIASSAQQVTRTCDPSHPIPVAVAAALVPVVVVQPLPAGRWKVTYRIDPDAAETAAGAPTSNATATANTSSVTPLTRPSVGTNRNLNRCDENTALPPWSRKNSDGSPHAPAYATSELEPPRATAAGLVWLPSPPDRPYMPCRRAADHSEPPGALPHRRGHAGHPAAHHPGHSRCPKTTNTVLVGNVAEDDSLR